PPMHHFLHLFLFAPSADLLSLHSFPTRRSSDLLSYFLPAWPAVLSHNPKPGSKSCAERRSCCSRRIPMTIPSAARAPWRYWRKTDRKSTRLNSSHGSISYAVFCLKKKKKKKKTL